MAFCSLNLPRRQENVQRRLLPHQVHLAVIHPRSTSSIQLHLKIPDQPYESKTHLGVGKTDLVSKYGVWLGRGLDLLSSYAISRADRERVKGFLAIAAKARVA